MSMFYDSPPEIQRRAEQLRKRTTETERILWSVLRNKKPKFRRQHPVWYYIVDFYSHKARLSVEIDGLYHLNERQKILDKERTRVITSLGIKELRFSNVDIHDNLHLVLMRIDDELKRRLS